MSPPCWWWRLDHWHDLLCYLIMMLLLDMTMELACIRTMCVWWFQTTLLPLFVNSCCNNYVNSDVCEILVNYLWNGCNMWLVMLNHVQSWLYASWFKILHGFSGLPVYMGSSMTVWSLRWLLSYLCSYKLVGSVIVRFDWIDAAMMMTII